MCVLLVVVLLVVLLVLQLVLLVLLLLSTGRVHTVPSCVVVSTVQYVHVLVLHRR